MLIEWKVIKPKEEKTLKKVKKRTTKWKKNHLGIREEYSTEVSGSGDSCYSLHKV